MCGINGFNWNDEIQITNMNNIIKHRGPDDEGKLVDNNISLGHVRLSIIDLSNAGHQPMSNEDDMIWITYNGEVYNFQELRSDLEKKGHVFKSNTDTEVIIHAYEEYGLDCVKQFNGMWAFCIYDKNKDILVLSRDQFAIKPLYYYIENDKFIFSSMIAGILCHDIKTAPNDKAIMEYLAFNLEDHKEYTFFENIYSLSSGEILTYNLKTHRHYTQHWYNLEFRKVENERVIRDKFIDSVRLRTISDVPVGSCLSGGIDSSAIVCTLDTILKNEFFTFSLVSPGSSKDETKYIQEVGRNTNTQQFLTTIGQDDFLREVDDFIITQEEPVTGLSAYAQYCVMKLAHEQGAKVLIDGQGADEIFAGDIYYYSYYFFELFTEFKWYTLIKEMILYIKNFKNVSPHSMLAFLFLPESLKYITWKTFDNKWINHDMLEKLCVDKDPRWKATNLNGILRLTLFSTSIPHLLRWEDKNSMRWSIESRVPFLDLRLVELADSLPSEQKLRNGRTKVVFKKALEDLIPDMIRNRKDKIGFEAPVDDLFRNKQIVEFCKGIIYSESFKNRPYWKWNDVEKIFNSHIQNKKNAGDTIWKWINLEIWLREFFDIRKSVKSKNNKILVVSHSYSAFVKDQIEQISKDCTEITVLARYNPIAEISNIFPINDLKPFTKASTIDLLNKPPNVNVMTSPILYMPTDSEYKELGEKHFKVVEKQIKDNNIKFDLIHSHFSWSAGYVGAKLKEKYNVRFIVTVHGFDIYDLPFKNNEWREKIEYVLNAADYIITVSESNLKCIKQLNIKTPVKVIPNGFTAKLFYPRDSKNCRNTLNLPLDKKIILTVGTLVEIKGHKHLIEAIGEVVKHRKDILCIIIGSGELKNKLQKQIKKAGLEKYIILAGGRPHNEIPIWMNSCDVFALPSLRESFGVVQIEAMACGKPVVATYNGGSEEIILSDELGYLTKPKNSAELAKIMLKALDKEWNNEKIIEYAKQFMWKNVAKNILKVYEMVAIIGV
jgi:asparagine synthase (glutamine-hydrolysing)